MAWLYGTYSALRDKGFYCLTANGTAFIVSDMIEKKTCSNTECSEEFHGTKRAKYCSDACRASQWRKGDKMLTLKIGRNDYEITKDDKFLDNGACIQLMTQNKNKPGAWGRRPPPVLSKRAEKELKGFLRSQHKHKYGAGCEVFSISAV